MATAVVGGVLLLIVGAVLFKLIRDKRAGKNSCGCGCTGDCCQCGKTKQQM